MKSITKYLCIITTLFLTQFLFSQVGINTILPLSTLDINGNLSVKVLNLNGGPGGSATPIIDGIYISLTPTGSSPEFFVQDPTLVPGRTYVLRNVTDTDTAQIYMAGGKLFFPKNSKTGTSSITMPPDNDRKTVILFSDGFNWTYFF